MVLPAQLKIRNGILARLPARDLVALRSRIERISIGTGDILQAAGEPARSIFFVESGIISLLAPLQEGGRIEIGHVGREGAAGVHAALGAETLTSEIMAQSDGVVLRVKVASVRSAMERSRLFRQGVVNFANCLHSQVAQTAACNGTHDVVKRLARWLLMVHDRTDGDTLTLTHELISLMLGVTRPGVTIAAGTLQKAGLVQYSRGSLTIVDRDGLEQASCECYGIVADYYASEIS
jgi:CRP-like cAMP-binding protein